MKKLLYISHGLIFAVAAPIIQYILTRGEVVYEPPGRIVPPLIFSLVLYLVLISVAMFVFRNLVVGGILASLLILAFLYLWPIFDIVVIALVVGFCLLWIVLKKPSMLYIHLTMLVAGILLCAYYLFQFISFLSSVPEQSDRSLLLPLADQQGTPSLSNDRPDIYYIILDAYGRADMLQNVYGFNNDPFVQALEQRGFIVPSLSRSNYPRTILSLSSSLNMQYLDRVEQAVGSSTIWWPLEDTIHYSQVRTFLEDQGYRTVFFATRFDATDIRDGTYYVKPFAIMPDNLDEAFVDETNLNLFPPLLKQVVFFSSIDSFRKLIQFDLSDLPLVAGLPGPKFVFLHIISPHPPFLFNANGPIAFKKNTVVSIGDGQGFGGSVSDYRIGYTGQVSYLDPQVLKMIDDLLANSPKKPIIIIQGDHGPGMYLNYNSAASTCIYERFSILNAYYFPGVDPATVPPDISPVDTFRFVFNHYFGTHFDYLPSRQYFAPDATPFQFQDVTNQYQPAEPTCHPSKAPAP